MDDEYEFELPLCIELKPSKYITNELGVFTNTILNADQFLGNYKGKRRDSMAQCIDPEYAWTILSSRQMPLFCIDASDPKDSNWLRFIRWTSDPNKYNVICMQQNQQINYFTLKVIEANEELVTYLPAKKKQNNLKGKTKDEIKTTTYRLVSEKDQALQEDENTEDEPDVSESHEKIAETPVIQQTMPEEEFSAQQSHNNYEDDFDTTLNKTLTCDICSFCCTMWYDIKIHEYKTHINPNYIKINDPKTLDIIKCFLSDRQYDDKSILLTNKLITDTMCDAVCDTAGTTVNTANSTAYTRYEKLMDYRTGLIGSYALKYDLYRCHQCLTSMHCKTELKKHLVNCKTTLSHATDQDDTNEKEHIQSLKRILVDLTSFNDDLKTIEIPKSERDDADDEDEAIASDSSTVEKSASKQFNERDNSSTTSSGSTNGEDSMKFTCNLCKQRFDDRMSLSKHQRTELQLKLEKKKKETRKKKLRELHFKHKIDLSYIETTQLNNLTQQIADNLGFCIDGTTDDLKSYGKEIKDYIQTELGPESDIHMFLKCFPEMYEKLALKHSPNLDVNICRKANTYFANCFYVPYEKDSLLKQTFHCKTCKSKSKTLFDLIKHQRIEHGASLKTMFESNDVLNAFDRSPVGYLRCDPFALMLNMYWDLTHVVECDTCNKRFIRGVFKKHSDTCGDHISDTMTTIETVECQQAVTNDEVVAGRDKVVKEEPVDNNSPVVSHKEDDEREPPKEDKPKRTRQSSNRSLDANNVVADKRRSVSIQSQFAAENFVFFGGSGSTGGTSGAGNSNLTKNRETKLPKQVTATAVVSSTVANQQHIKKEDASNSSSSNTSCHDISLANSQLPLLASALSSYDKSTTHASETNRATASTDIVLPVDQIRRRRRRKRQTATKTETNDHIDMKSSLSIDADDKTGAMADEHDDSPQQPEKRVSRRIKKLSLKKMEADFDNAIIAAAVVTPTTSKHQHQPIEPVVDGRRKKQRKSSLDSCVQQKMDVSIVSTDEASSDASYDDDNRSRKKAKNDGHQQHPDVVDGGLANGCEICGLVFTSANSVVRHREKSCVGMRIVNIPTSDASNPKKKCPLCQRIFFNTHSISIHIQKYHGVELGLAGSSKLQQQPTTSKTETTKRGDELVEKQRRHVDKPKLVIKLKSTNKYYKPKKKKFQQRLVNFKKRQNTQEEPETTQQTNSDQSSTSVTHISDLSISSLSMSNNTEQEQQQHQQQQAKSQSGKQVVDHVSSSFVFVDDEDVNNKKFIGIRLCPYCNGQFRIKLKYKKHMPLCEMKHRRKMNKKANFNIDFDIDANGIGLKELFENNDIKTDECIVLHDNNDKPDTLDGVA